MKRYAWIATALSALLLLGGCQGKKTESASYQETYPTMAMTAAKNVSYGASASYGTSASYDRFDVDDSMVMEEDFAYDYEDEIEVEEAEEAVMDTSMSMDAGEAEAGQDQEQPNGLLNQEKLVYTGNLTVETTAFGETLSRIKQTIQEMGGFIEWESDNDNSYGWYREDYTKSSSTLSASLQVRIPSGRFQEFLDGIEGEGAKVTSRYVNVENISRRYSETALSIESYEIQERRLLEMMEEAKRVSDMLEIEARLSEVQTSLKQLKNNLSSMDTDVAYSTVSIYLQEVGIYSQPKATTFGEKVQEAFSDGIHGFVDGVQNFALWLIRNLFSLLLLAVIVVVAIAMGKKLVKKAIKKREQRKAEGKPEKEIGKVKE